jgi:hypothetical protein
LATLVWLLMKASAASCRSDDMPGELCRLLAASFVFVLIWNLAAYRFVRHDYGFFWIIFAGTAYSFRLRRLIDN